MPGNPSDPIATALREHAEERLVERMSARKPDTWWEDKSVQHELEVHQIELEMQNEELLRAQDELTELANRYAELYDHAPVSYFTLDHRGVISQANFAGARLLGTERSRIAGKRFGSFVAQADLPEFNAFLGRVFSDQSQPRCEVTLTLGNQPVFVLMTATLTPGALECRAVVIDINDRKRAKMALEKSRSLLAETETIGKVGGWEFDIDTKRQTWTDELYRIHELETSYQPTVANGIDFYTPECRPVIERAVQRAITLGEAFDVELEIITAKGNRRWVHAIGKPDLDHRRVYGFFQDVTERRRAEDALREANQFSHQIIHSVQEGLIVYDLDMRYLIWNPFMEQLTGLPAAEVLGRHPLEIFPFLKEMGVMAVLEKARAGESPKPLEFQYSIPATGRFGWGLEVPAPLRNAYGEIIGVIGTVRDITASKRAEEALHDLSRRLLKAEDDERRRIAKELHDSTAQDLVAVMMTLDALRETLLERGDKRFQQLEDGLAILEKSTNDLRTLSYLLHPPRLEDAGLVGAIRHYAEGFGERTGIAIILELPDDLGRLTEDVELVLFRVTQESLGNIHRHARSPTATIRFARDASMTVLEIRDTGCGFPVSLVPSEGESFPRLGVGIPAMRERLLQIGGHLEIESRACGTIVRAILPTITKRQENK